MDNNKHDLFLELTMFAKNWQVRYKTLRDAAIAAGVLGMFQEWLLTPEGQHYRDLTENVPDTEAQNAAERQMRERMLRDLRS